MNFIKIENAAKTFFQTKEEYKLFRLFWAEHYKETYQFGQYNEHKAGKYSALDHALYLIICGRDLSKAFKHRKCVQDLLDKKLPYGTAEYHHAKSLYDASWEPAIERNLRLFAKCAVDLETTQSKRVIAEICETYGNTITEEAVKLLIVQIGKFVS
jgi:hypothetical protein